MFAASFAESVAVIGTIVPGSTIVFVGGMLVGLKALDPWLATIAAVAGATAGDGISYFVGRRYHDAIRSMWPLRDHPQLLARGEAYFGRHGGKSVFLGRFFGPTRAVVPIIAGMSNMPRVQFYTMNVLSAIAWAVAHLLPGALFGASLQLAGAVSARLVALVALIVVGLWVIAVVIRLVIRLAWPYVRVLQERIVRHVSERPGFLAKLVLPLVDPARRESTSLLVAATLLIGGAWLFLGVVEDVVTRDTLVETDHTILDALQALRTGGVDDVMVTLTQLGSTYVTVAVVVVVSIWFAVMRRWQTLAYWVGASTFAAVLVLVLKTGFSRVRPETPYALVDPYSFPSGHAALSIVVYGFLAFLVAHGKPGWQKIAVALPAAGIAVLIAFSRLYLGAHWFSDVAASVGLGLAWIGLLCIAYIHHVRERPLRALPTLLVTLTALAFFGTAYAHRYHDRDIDRYAKPAALRTLTLDAWRGGDWQGFPRARSEVRGQREEPFSLQWAASTARIGEVLRAAGWREPAPWKSSAALLWLVPATPIGELPVLPKLHQGQAPALTFVRPLDATTRLVLRLWHVAEVSDGSHAEPLWTGIVTAESGRMEFGLVATARTTGDVAAPLQAFDQAVRGAGANVRKETALGMPVLLVW
ncbi:MAG: VTT domain-containing protein [Betaproteobacteria bacterium]|nr:VTT domain-containing protein [Casimicrobiaceae bacterium]